MQYRLRVSKIESQEQLDKTMDHIQAVLTNRDIKHRRKAREFSVTMQAVNVPAFMLDVYKLPGIASANLTQA